MPSLEMVRLVSSGTEATMSALRVARGFTGRDKIVKIDGGYHGHSDACWSRPARARPRWASRARRASPPAAVADTLAVPCNDLDAMRAVFEAHRGEIAARHRRAGRRQHGLRAAAPRLSRVLRALCDEHGALLIFDEVMTGFRVAFGGAQPLYGVDPDLTCLGKIVGGGLPVGAYGGRARS